MQIEDILKCVDHTNLSQAAKLSEIKNLCDQGIKYKVASVCIPPSYVKEVKSYVGDTIKICTVIGFPNGYSTTESKSFETDNAIKNGANEIDMVINIGWVKDFRYSDTENEIKAIKDICGDKILKVIIETCLLTHGEKIELCKMVSDSGADYIKTSTGFSKSGANAEDIKLLSRYVDKRVKVKAAGGISNLNDAENFIKAGASRLGSSKMIKFIEEQFSNILR